MAGRRASAFVTAALLLAVTACSDPSEASTAPVRGPGAGPSSTSAGPAGSSASPDPTGASPSTSTPSATTGRAAQQDAVDRLFAAGAAGDRSAWAALTSTVDPAFADRSALLLDNLSRLPLDRLRVRLTGTEATLSSARRAALGGAADVVQARLVWRLDGERADATSTVWLTLVPSAEGPRLAGTGDGSSLDTPAQPLWWLGPVTEARRGPATVLAGPGQDAERWASRAAEAAADARRHLPRPLGRDWDGRVVVEVPGTEADFTQVLGASPASYARTAAVTRPEGPTTEAALRVVVNPAAGSGSEDELGLLLTHETVHVATRSAASPAPLWAVEGLAERVALEAHPDQRADELASLRGHDPDALPKDSAFGAGAKDVNAAYAQAWLACRAVAERRGDRGLGRLYAALDDGRTLDQAARSALGVDGATVARWAQDERRRADVPG